MYRSMSVFVGDILCGEEGILWFVLVLNECVQIPGVFLTGRRFYLNSSPRNPIRVESLWLS